MRLVRLVGLFVFSLALGSLTPAGVSAQQGDSLAAQASMESFARTHAAIAALRDRVQAELAEPKSKKPEVQAELREKLRTERLRLLKEHGLTEDAFTRLTHRVAVDDEARKAFEAALARLAEKKWGRRGDDPAPDTDRVAPNDRAGAPVRAGRPEAGPGRGTRTPAARSIPRRRD